MTKSRARKFAELLDGSDNIKSARLSNAQSDMVDDTSPQLGGTLDTNGNPINDASGVTLQHNGANKFQTTANGIDVLRPASDGTIQSWKRGTTEVAKLSVNSTDNITFSAMQGGGSGLQFWGGGGTDPVISPMKQGVSSDNTVELGRSNIRFKKVHFTQWGTAPAGTIIQVKSFNYSSITTSSFSNSGASNTPLYVDITPKSTSSRMFITVHMFGEFSDTYAVYNTPVALLRGSTLLKNSNGSASGISSFTQSYFAADDDSTPEVCSFQYWDAPATTNSVRYRVTLGPNNNSGTRYFYFNRTVGSSTSLGYERGISNITVMEVAN